MSKPALKVMGLDALNESRLRLQLTEVIPKLEITAAERARPPADKTAAASSSQADTGSGGKAAGEAARLWHSKHFVWYRLPPLQRLRPASLADGVFGPTLGAL